MKHYKIINNIQFGGNLITCISYNLSWKALSGKIEKCFLNKKNICKINILENIKNVIENYDIDFATFQEVVIFNEITKLFNHINYDFYVNNSDKEFMLSIWNKKKFKLIEIHNGEFEKGRPFTIIILQCIKTNKNIALINLHAGHIVDTQKSIFNIINNYIKTNLTSSIKKSISRVIMSGDFNRDVFIDKTSDYIIKFSKKFELKRFENNVHTCCSIVGYGHKFNYDHILDSKSVIYDKKIYKNKILASDHLMIIATIKN